MRTGWLSVLVLPSLLLALPTGCVVDDWNTFRKDGLNAKEFLTGSKKPNYVKRDLKLNKQNQKNQT